MKGKKGLVTGTANGNSIAFGAARAFHEAAKPKEGWRLLPVSSAEWDTFKGSAKITTSLGNFAIQRFF